MVVVKRKILESDKPGLVSVLSDLASVPLLLWASVPRL